MGRKQDKFSDIRPMVYARMLTIGRTQSAAEIEQNRTSGRAHRAGRVRSLQVGRSRQTLDRSLSYFVTRPATH